MPEFDPDAYLAEKTNAQPSAFDPSQYLAEKTQPQQGGFLQTAEKAANLANEAVMALYRPPGQTWSRLMFPEQHAWENRPIVPESVIKPVVETLATPQRKILESALGERGKKLSEFTSNFLTQNLAGVTTPESLGFMLAGGVVGKMPNLREIAFGKPPPVPEALGADVGVPISSEPIQTKTAAVEEVNKNAIKQSDAQMEARTVAQREQARPPSEKLPASPGDYVVREGQGEAAGGQVSQEVGGGAPTVQPTGVQPQEGLGAARVGSVSEPPPTETSVDTGAKPVSEQARPQIPEGNVSDSGSVSPKEPFPPAPTTPRASEKPSQPAGSSEKAAAIDNAKSLEELYSALGREMARAKTNAELKKLQTAAQKRGSELEARQSTTNLISEAKKAVGAEELRRRVEQLKHENDYAALKKAMKAEESPDALALADAASLTVKGEWESRKQMVIPDTGSRPVSEQAPPQTPEPPAATTAPTSSEPQLSAIANRFTKERVERGEIGEIAPGQGHSTQELVQRGLKMTPEEVNQHVSDLQQGVGDIVKQGEAVRAEEARLSQRSNQLSRESELDPTNMEKKLAADNAFKDLTDFHNGPIATLKNKWHQAGMGLQGEIPVDLSTYNGLREAWLKDVGTPPPPQVEPLLRKTAERVAKSNGEANGSRAKLGDEITKATANRKLPTYEQVRDGILSRLRERTPC